MPDGYIIKKPDPWMYCTVLQKRMWLAFWIAKALAGLLKCYLLAQEAAVEFSQGQYAK